MYICPICNKECKTEEIMAKHLLVCWKETNPNHKSKPAPRSEDIVTRSGADEATLFFQKLKGK